MATATTAAENRPERGSRWRGCGGAQVGSTEFCPSLPALSVAATAAFLVLLAAATLPGSAEAYVLRGCYGQTDSPNFDVGKCRYGWEVDACGRHSCTKGPGDHCGGKDNLYGTCGEGLMCSNCNRCIGCSRKTFECFDDRLCITGFK